MLFSITAEFFIWIFFLKSFTYAFNGIKLSLQQSNMKVHVCCAILAIASGFIFKINTVEWCIILICIGVVLALETINTAINRSLIWW